MRALLNFIKYNNTFPLLLIGVLVAAGAVLAATGDIPSPLSSQNRSLTPKAHVPTDTSLLLQQDLAKYRMKVHIDGITENTTTYQVQYSFNSIDIVDGRWQETQKQKSMIVDKGVLGKRSLTDYLAEQISQVTQQEIAYLTEVQSKTFGSDRQQGNSTKYANLVGKELALNQNTAQGSKTSGSKDTAGQQTNASSDASSGKTTPSVVPGVSEQELRQLIVQAVADFLAIDTTPLPSGPVVVPTDPVVAGEAVTEPSSETAEESVLGDNESLGDSGSEEESPLDDSLPGE